MTTLELAKKLDQCLAAQVKLQEERDALLGALDALVNRLNNCELGPVHSGRDIADQIAKEAAQARAALARVQS